MPHATDNLMQAITETRQLLAQAERNLSGAQKNSSHANAAELEQLLRDIRALHNRILTLTADVNREVIDKTARSNHDPRNRISQK